MCSLLWAFISCPKAPEALVYHYRTMPNNTYYYNYNFAKLYNVKHNQYF